MKTGFASRGSAAWLGTLLIAACASGVCFLARARAEIAPPPDAMAALEKPRVRKIAVPAFHGQGADSLRQVVLDVLTRHPDLEILGQPDLEVIAKRLGAKIDDPQGRNKLSAELDIYAWLDGDTSRGELRLSDASGGSMARLALGRGGAAEEVARDRTWAELGPLISDEGMRERMVDERRAAAIDKLAAQDAEIERQTKLAEDKEKRRAQRLGALKEAAQGVFTAQKREVAHQSEIAQDRVRREQKEAAQKAEQARKEELARQAEARKQAEAQQRAEAAQRAEIARQTEAAQRAELARQNAYTSQNAYAAKNTGYAATPAPAVAVQPSYAPAPAPAPARPWAAGQPAGGGFGSGYAPAPAPAPAPVAQPAAQPSPDEVPGISEETRQWLQARKRQRGY